MSPNHVGSHPIAKRVQRGGLRTRLFLAFGLSAAVTAAVLGWIGFYFARSQLQRQVEERLRTVASTMAVQVNPGYALALEPGDEETELVLTLRTRLARMRDAARVKRVFVLNADRIVLDTDDPAIGRAYERLDADSAALAAASGDRGATASPLYRSADGTWYMRAYVSLSNPGSASAAPESGNPSAAPAAVLGVEAGVTYFDALRLLGKRLVGFGALGAAMTLLVAWIVARTLVRPLRSLEEAAERIAEGEYDSQISVDVGGEVGHLAAAMEQMRDQIVQRDRRMQLMMRGIAHEVRNPLGGIELFAAALYDDLGGDPELRDRVERIRAEIRSIDRLVNDFLAYARTPALNTATVYAADVCRQARTGAESIAEAAGIEIEVHAPTIQFVADEEKLRIAIVNLLRNAVQATEPGGVVELVAVQSSDFMAAETPRLRPGRVRFAVLDRGHGLSNSNSDLFEPFVTTKEKGSGLGLALVRQIAVMHGGEAGIASRKDGGVVAWLDIPMSPP